MGCLTAKASGTVASFINPTVTDIESARVYFSPTQLGEGTPSPDNVREIVGRTGVELYHSGRNLAHIVGYSAQSLNSNNIISVSNKYGTTINTTKFLLPDTKLVITQVQYPNADTPISYQNGYAVILVDNLIWGQNYNVSFKVQDITSNPLNASLQNIRLLVPSGTSYQPEVNGDKLLFKNVVWKPYSAAVGRRNFEIRICGMSFTLSEFMVMPVEDDNYDFKPYQGTTYSIDWTDDAGNIYGGYVDLVKGEIVEEWQSVTYNGSETENWVATSIQRYYINLPNCAYVRTDNKNIFCNKLSSVSASSLGSSTSLVCYTNGANSIGIRIGTEIDTKDKLLEWLSENPITIVQKLTTPITHQLTPTQLQTFKNENNIWSDGDSVEIDYDLAETFDIQKAKRKIIMNQPHVETLTGDAVSFTTDMKAPLKECKVSFMPVQEGSGDPSPSNVRNITGWTGVSVKNGENTYSIDWTDDAGTVYGGYVDLVSGELVATHVRDALTKTVESLTDNYNTETTVFFRCQLTNNAEPIGTYQLADLKCDSLKPSDVINIWGSPVEHVNEIVKRYGASVNNKVCMNMYKDVFGITSEDTLEQQKTKIDSYLQENPIYVSYKLATPITYQLTPQQILSLKGINNFSCGIKNDMNIKYWKHKLSDSANIAYEAENLAFDGTNYIDTGIYLFSEENINRDFEVVIEDLYGSANTYQHQTIVCAKYDSTAIGFLIRLNSQTSAQYNGTIGMKKDNHNNITIKRINGVITIDGEVITNPTVKFTNTVHNHPLVLGCALEDNGTPMRYATGTIGHIIVKWL